MAYLNDFRTDGRGQLFIIGAIALALIFVGLTILLNTAIYTENLASRGTNVGGSSQELVQRDVVEFVDTNMEYVNTNQTAYGTYATKRDSQVDMIAAWADMNSIAYGQEGRIARISVTGSDIERGIRIGQTDVSRDFNSAAGDDDWLLSADNNRVRDFDLVIDRSALASTGASNEFTVHLLRPNRFLLTGVNTSYEFRIGQSGTNDVDVSVYVSGVLSETCTTQANATGYAHIELAEGKVGGDDCEAIDTAFRTARLNGGYPLYYENSNNVAGTWNAYLERGSPYLGVPPGQFPSGAYTSGPSAGSPFEYPAMYATEVTVQVASEDGVVTRTIRVAPGESQ